MKPFRKNIVLASVFIIALPVFFWLRWDPAPWFNAQLESHELSPYVQVAKVEKSGMGLRLDKVRIRIHRMPDIKLDSLQFNPAWSRILRGTLALHVRGNTGDATFGANISMRDGAIRVRKINLRAQAGMIMDYVPRAAMLNLAGNILISGKVKLLRRDGLPLAGDMTIRWKKAVSGLLGKDPLGDFRLQLTSSEKSKWRWRIEGGKALSINGNGHLSPPLRSPGPWKVDGNIDAQARGRVASLLAGMTGHDRWNLVLSGNLSRPRLELRKP